MRGGRGNFDIDHEYLKKCEQELEKKNKKSEFDEAAKEKAEDGRSMLEVMRAKREAAEKAIASMAAFEEKEEKKESVEERGARLKAQRDLIRQQKADKRAAELEKFNAKTE